MGLCCYVNISETFLVSLNIIALCHFVILISILGIKGTHFNYNQSSIILEKNTSGSLAKGLVAAKLSHS